MIYCTLSIHDESSPVIYGFAFANFLDFVMLQLTKITGIYHLIHKMKDLKVNPTPYLIDVVWLDVCTQTLGLSILHSGFSRNYLGASEH